MEKDRYSVMNLFFCSQTLDALTPALNLAHHMRGLTQSGRLLVSPATEEKLRRMLNVGTGTSIWASDFGMKSSVLRSRV